MKKAVEKAEKVNPLREFEERLDRIEHFILIIPRNDHGWDFKYLKKRSKKFRITSDGYQIKLIEIIKQSEVLLRVEVKKEAPLESPKIYVNGIKPKGYDWVIKLNRILENLEISILSDKRSKEKEVEDETTMVGRMIDEVLR